MNDAQLTIEEQAAIAFDQQAPFFDNLYGENTITRYKRKRVRDHVECWLPANASMLELNAGTGEDAIYFARKGHRVHATDISPGMQEVLKKKLEANRLEHAVSLELRSFTQLDQLEQRGPYDYVFSNFAGLNCTGDLKKVLASLHRLVKPGGHITLVLLPKFCLWEFLLLFRGKFRTAFRRFSGRKGTTARIDDKPFRCWYYNPSYVQRQLKKSFKLCSIEGLCSLVPPSYMEYFAEKWPRLFRVLVKLEDRWKKNWPWRSAGDYYIISLQKKR